MLKQAPGLRVCYQTLRQAWSRRTLDRNMRSRYRCSMCPAIHINSRSWLRSSSTCEPSDPPLRVCQTFLPLLAQRYEQSARPPALGLQQCHSARFDNKTKRLGRPGKPLWRSESYLPKRRARAVRLKSIQLHWASSTL